jgi:hypothetical protein
MVTMAGAPEHPAQAHVSDQRQGHSMATHWIYRLIDRGKVGATRVLRRRLRQQKYSMPEVDARVEVLAVYVGLDDATISERGAAWSRAYGCDVGIPYRLNWSATQSREQKAEYARRRWGRT